jgi:hypothetical protein
MADWHGAASVTAVLLYAQHCCLSCLQLCRHTVHFVNMGHTALVPCAIGYEIERKHHD